MGDDDMRAQGLRFGITMAVMTLVAMCGSQASAGPIVVTESTTGPPGNYTLDFSVTNNLGGTNAIYLFGVYIDSGTDFVGSPAQFAAHEDAVNVAVFGGSNIIYNNAWLDNVDVGLANGATLGGFEVGSTDTTLPASVHWFAFAEDGTYTGGGNFNTTTNPGFEGLVNLQSVPEPSAMLLGVVGSLGVLTYWLKRSRTARSRT
jgi:hypothetical protein